MLENSRKRARKSKLEIREGVELEEATVLYMEALDTKVKEEPIIDVGPTKVIGKNKIFGNSNDVAAPAENKPMMEFSVKIEVEEFDELETKETDTSDTTNKTAEVNEGKDNSTSALDVKPTTSDKATDVETKTQNVRNEFKEYVTNRPMMLKTAERLLKSEQVVDQILAVVVRNYAGRVLDEPLRDARDKILYSAMEEWKNWNMEHSAVRDTPLMYKCYICGKSWWYLYDFKEHILKHVGSKEFEVSLETNNDECSLICCQLDIVYNDGELPKSDCDRCGKKADLHAFVENNPYKCLGCKTTFSTCTQLKFHENQCPHYRKLVFKDNSELHKCSVCVFEFDSEDNLNRHMIRRHSVRSDVVTLWDVRLCSVCSRTYVLHALHVCVKKTNNYGCNYCGRSFQKKIYKEIHMANYNKPMECRLCARPLLASCMEYSHMLQHTDKYALMYKCIQCIEGRYYPDEFSIVHHTNVVHDREFEKKFKYLEMVILPKQCLERSKLTKIKNEPDKLKMGITEKEISNVFVPSVKYRNPHKVSAPPTDVVIKQEVDVDEPDINTLCVTDLGTIKTEAEDTERRIQISDITSLQEFIKFKTEPVEEVIAEDLIIVEDKSETITLYSSDDSENDFRLKYTGDKRKKLVRVACVCGYVDIRSRLKAHKQACTITQAKRAAKRARLAQATVKGVLDKLEADDDSDDDNLGDDNLDDDNLGDDDNLDDRDNSDDDWGQGVPLENNSKSGLKYTCHCKKVFVGTLAAFRRHKKACIVVAKLKQQRKDTRLPTLYTCTKCNTDFNSILRYCKHFHRSHFYQKYMCPQCWGVFDSLGKLTGHVTFHVNKSFLKMRLISVSQEWTKSNRCKVCKEPVEKKDYFQHWESHLELASGDTEPVGDSEDSQNDVETLVIDMEEDIDNDDTTSVYSAEVMQKALAWLQSPDGYGNIDEKTCVFCARRFSRKNDSKRHVIEHLLQDAYAQKAVHGELRCQICYEGFPKDDRFKHHMREHASLPVYQCDLCGKSFSDSSNFCKHRKVHGLSLTCCAVCDKRFHNENHLARHMEMHERTKPIVCDTCGKISYTVSAHKKHVRCAHERHKTRVLCPVCRVGFTRLKDKWDHMWMVHKERKFNADCPICSAGFRRFADVKTHVRMAHQRNVRMTADRRMVVYA